MSDPLVRVLALACALVLPGWALAQTTRGEAAEQPLTTSAKAVGVVSRASGVFPCARDASQPMALCRFGVTRQGGGDGRVTVTLPGRGERVIVFANGAPSSFERTAPADGDMKMTVQRDADRYLVTIGTERFEIPDVVITGG